MFSICCNSCIKLWRSKKVPANNNKNETFYKWEGINFPSKKDYWKNVERNNVTITLNVL